MHCYFLFSVIIAIGNEVLFFISEWSRTKVHTVNHGKLRVYILSVSFFFSCCLNIHFQILPRCETPNPYPSLLGRIYLNIQCNFETKSVLKILNLQGTEQLTWRRVLVFCLKRNFLREQCVTKFFLVASARKFFHFFVASRHFFSHIVT